MSHMQSQPASHQRHPTPTGVKIEDDDLEKFAKSIQPCRDSVITNKNQMHRDPEVHVQAVTENQNVQYQNLIPQDLQQIQLNHITVIFAADDQNEQAKKEMKESFSQHQLHWENDVQLTDRGGREVQDDESLINQQMAKQVIPEKPGKPKETAPETTLGKNKSGEKVQDETSQAKPEVKAKVGRIPFFKLFKYSSCGQKLLVAIGIISAIISGAAAPTISIIFGEIVAIFDPRNEPQVIEDGIIKLFKLIAVLCSILWVFGYLQYACLQAAAERLSFDLRSLYLSALLKQETEYFEKKQVESMPSQIAEFFQAIGEGVGEKVGQLVYTIAMFIGGLAIAFWYGPIFTLICLAYTPLMVGAIAIFGGLVSKKMKDKLEQTKKLGAHTEETLSALKLVVSFAQEDLALSQYDKIASESNQIAKTAGMFQSLVHGVFLALMFGFFVFCYATGKWLIQDGAINPASGKIYTVVEIIQVSQASMMAMMTFAQVFPIVPAIIKALVVGKEVFDVIERVPLIRSPDVPSESSNKICIDEGIIFENVSFRYPTAPVNSRDVFSKVSFTIRPYTSTAIVGPSGSGKSTIVQLLNRFYDPSEVSSAQGTIYLGKDDLKSKDLTALRGMIGYVSQEPVLILGTIRDNLLFCNKDATEEDMEQTLKKADAGFVFELEKGLDTYVGSGSVLNLSGGQKQRIAIARALIKKPKILVLDEATSALDPKSEAEVQAAISKIQKEEGDHITVIMIAHRLQTIETAQNLLYLDEPYRVLAGEKGTAEYEEIMERLRKTNYAHQQEEEQKGENAENKETNKKLKTQMTLKSQPSLKDDDKEKEVEQLSSVEKVDERRQSRKGNGWCRIFTYYQPKIFAFFMMVTAGINALSFPTLGYLVAKIQMILMGNDYLTDWREQVSLYLWLFLGLCILIGLATGIEKAMFTTTGENLTFNVRRDLIRGILFKQVSWFDREDRAPGILTNVLSEDVSALNGMTTETISVLAEAFLSLTLGMLISLIISWKMALCTVAVSPVMLVGVIAMSRLQWGNKRGKSKADQDASGVDEYEKSNALLSDVILNYRTVIGFGQKNVNVVVNRFQKLLEEPSRKKVKNAHIGGFFFGYSNCARMLFLGIVFLIGSELVRKYSDQSDDIYMSIWILFSTCMGAGIAMSNVPSVQKAKNSASNIFAIIDESSTLDVRESSGEGIKTISEGKIEFKDVNFSYPTRKAFVLNKFNMKIPSTQKIALVGHSGCGKSTITNLLLRFYNIQEGTIEIDGINLVDYDVKALRRQIGYVMQEPVLFNQSIRQNILYGELNASDEQILKVAEMANALTFIESNVEDLDKEQRKVKTAMDLVEEIKKISQSKPKFGLLASGDLNELQTNLLLNVLKKADPIAINLIEEAPAAFMKQLQEDSKVPGMKWDDLVLNFEWTFEFKKILASDKLDKETKEIVEQTGQSLKYWFNLAMVQAWAANRAESLFEYVQSNQQIFLEARQERIKKLQASMIDKLRDPVTGKIKLSEGFDKNCGLKGQKLSGGQKQRIAIARALIKDPKILILDEATSALDEQSQEIVQQALDRAMEGRTSIVIAHRLSTIRNCNLLFVLNNGKIVETGTYDELSNNDQSYFYKLKSGMEM